MYKLTTYLKDLPQQSVSSKKNLQVVLNFAHELLMSFLNIYIVRLMIVP